MSGRRYGIVREMEDYYGVQKLQSDMVAAMKARDKARKDTISSLISAVKKLAIDEGKRDDIPDELVDRAIIKEEKQRRNRWTVVRQTVRV